MKCASVSAVPTSDSVALQVSGLTSPAPPELTCLSDRLTLAESEISENRSLAHVVESRISEIERDLENRIKNLEQSLSNEKSENENLSKTLAQLNENLDAKDVENSKNQSLLEDLTLKSEKDKIVIAELTQVSSCLQDKLSEAAQQRSLADLKIKNLEEAKELTDLENRRLTEEILKLQDQLDRAVDHVVEPPVNVGPVADLMSQSAHPLLNRSSTPPTFERENFQVGTSVYVVFNEETRQYILLTASRSIFYFVHENCLQALGLCPPGEIVDKVKSYGGLQERLSGIVTK